MDKTLTTGLDNISLELNFASWLAEGGKDGKGRSESSIESYSSDVRQFVRWFEDEFSQSFDCSQISSRELRHYYDHCKAGHMSAATWNRRRVSLALFCQFLLAKGLVAFDPFQGVPVMVKDEVAPRSLNKSDYFKFMHAVDQAVNAAQTTRQRQLAIRNRAMIALMVGAGLRVGEVCALERVQLLLSDRKGAAKFVGKDNKQADQPLGREVRLALSQWLEMPSSSPVLFNGITTRQAERIVSDLGRSVGLKLSCHALRHTYVYRMSERVNFADLKQLARHSRADQTMRYAMPHREDLERAVEDL